MQREPGFYWVKYEGKWIIAKWNKMDVNGDLMFWFLAGIDDFFNDSDFTTINEKRLLPPTYF